MRKEITYWDERDIPNTLGGDIQSEEQPGFGFKIIWNEPSKIFKPCLILHFWSLKIQAGFLLG